MVVSNVAVILLFLPPESIPPIKQFHHVNLLLLRGCLGLLCSTFFSFAPRFLAKQFQLHAISSRKKSGVVRAPKEVLHEL